VLGEVVVAVEVDDPIVVVDEVVRFEAAAVVDVKFEAEVAVVAEFAAEFVEVVTELAVDKLFRFVVTAKVVVVVAMFKAVSPGV
jgi:hypothetical protein